MKTPKTKIEVKRQKDARSTKKENDEKWILKWLAGFTAVVTVIMIMLMNFSNKIRVEATDTVEGKLEGIAENYALRVYNELESTRMVGETVAQILGQQEAISPIALERFLEAIVKNTQATEAVCHQDAHGSIDHLGNNVDLSSTEYTQLLHQNTTSSYFYIENDTVTGRDSILIIIPVLKWESDLVIFYPIERLEVITGVGDELERSTFIAVMKGDGHLLKTDRKGSNFLTGDSIWNNIDKEYRNASTKARVRIQNENVGCVAVAAHGERRTLAYAPVGINDWTLVLGVSQDYVNNSQDAIFTRAIRRLYQLMGVMLLFIIIFAVINYIGRIKNSENSKNLQEKADTDLLTGLNNKLATERKIKEYISQNPNSLAMMFLLDIDNFKKINDTMGHAFGDEVLRSLGKHIGANFRVTDIIGRSGGDEFTIFLKNLQSDENTLKEAKKLEIFFKNFQVGEYVKYSATASIGAAVFPADGADFDTLYKSADQALYKAKKRGKNQIAFYDDRDRKDANVQSV